MPKKPQDMIPVPNTQHEQRIQTFCNMIDEWLDLQEKAKEFYEFEFAENSVSDEELAEIAKRYRKEDWSVEVDPVSKKIKLFIPISLLARYFQEQEEASSPDPVMMP